MQKREANFQVQFGHWWKAIYRTTGLYELKQTKTGSLPFSSVAPHQIDALLNAKRGALWFKLPDMGYQNPADAVGLVGVPSFVVIKFSKNFYGIDIDDFITLRDSSPRKSLTEEMAKEKATFIG